MSGEKVTSPCSKFQANIFNKSKCQNCFKSRELHLLNDQDMEQAKPVYGGWLCLAPEGTDFDNPMQRSRKWQRRFFILYEHGSLSFALDELPSTLPQGTVNMNLCTDIADAEPRTGQRNALCIVTPEQEIFIRGDSKEIISGWSEQLVVYLRTNKQNQKKKRKVETVSAQEPSPPKMAATTPSSESTAASSRWQDGQRGGGANTTPMWTVADPHPPSPELTAADDVPLYLSPTLDRPSLVNSSDSEANGNPRSVQESDPDPENIQTSADDKNQSQNRSLQCQPASLKTTGGGQEGGAAASRTGRSEARTGKREKLQSCGDMAQLNAPPPQRRAKSLDRRTTDTVMTPDLLNFKKGWMVQLDENNQWRKYWFVLSTDSLRYYKDSVAEEASDLEGEIDLTKCYNVSEYQVQRNYGFQIHTPKGVYTLSAMTAGIRKNWIQALMKNVHPSNAPDVASLHGHHVLCSPPEALPKPDVTQDSTDVSSDPHPRPRSVMERRREGRYRTFDWAEFRPQTKPKQDADPPTRTPAPSLMELGDLARRKRRDERRRRYESMLGFPLDWEAAAGSKMAEGGVRALSPKSQQKVEEEIEEYWRQVERTVFRLDRAVPLGPETKDGVETERETEAETLLDTYRKAVEDLKAQLAESELSRLELEAQLNTNRKNQQNVCPSLDANFNPLESNDKPPCSHSQSLKDMYEETRELLQQQNAIRHSLQEQLASPQHHIPTIRLHDSDGNLTQLDDFLCETEVTPLLSPASESDSLHFDGLTLDVGQNSPSPEALLDISECSPTLLISAQDVTGDGVSLSCVDQAVLRRLSQEVELLTNQNKALNQRNQEMLNQLTEADREIERLKAELSGRYSEPLHLPESEQMGRTRVEELEKELNVRNQELMEAQTLITTLEENVKETEALLQLGSEAKETNVLEEKTEGYLLRCFEATEAKLSELERKLDEAEVTCRELQVENEQLKEAEKVCSERATEDVRRLKQELEQNQLQNGKSLSCLSGEERIQKVKEGVVLRFKALGKILEVIEKLDLDGTRRSTERDLTELKVVGQLRREEGFWRSLLGELEACRTNDEEPLEELLREVTEFMIVEKQMLILGHVPVSGGSESETSGDVEVVWSNASETAPETGSEDETTTSDFNYQPLDVDKSLIEHFSAITQIKLSLLDNIISAQSHLQLTTERVCEFLEHPWSGFIHSAATEALYCCHISSLQAVHQREMNQQRLNTSVTCSECVNLTEKYMEIRERLSNLEEQISHRTDTWTQTDETYAEDTDPEPQIGDEAEDHVEYKVNVDGSMEVSSVEDQREIQEMSDENQDTNGELFVDPGPNLETELILELRRRVEELEEQLRVTTEQMTEEMDEKMSSVQVKHEEEMEKLKATCERGFNSMEESHVKIVEELQRRHRQEVERLLVERDRLLEEESAATATAIEAIKNAHRLELEREVQRRCQSENSTADTHLEDLHRQHREELASYQRELQVLSQQYSLKCLENGHLVQALDAERKALCQCQQENQDLRTRNQELSGHLAAEITRLCSLAKQDELPLSQGMDVYEMEITLRVKESEVQCLKQEITSLKDELQSAQRDKRNATKKYKDMFTELSIVRAKTERDLHELRENLRLAHQALGQTSP